MPSIPFALQWTIDENDLLPFKESLYECLYSSFALDIPDMVYYLSISPNGDCEENRGIAVIPLHVESENLKKFEVVYTVTIESAKYSETYSAREQFEEGWEARICTVDEFFDPEKKFIVDGKCPVKVNGIFKFDNPNAPEFVKEQNWVGGELGDELWKKDDKKDFTIIVDGNKEIKVHKLILDTRSEVFAAMFNSNMKEAVENKVEITDFSFNVVEAALKRIYQCNFTSSLSLDELMKLLQFFDKYQLSSLKTKIEHLLIDPISAATVCRFTNASILTNSFKLKEKCIEFLTAAFESKTPLADMNDLNDNVIAEIVRNSLYQIVETEK